MIGTSHRPRTRWRLQCAFAGLFSLLLTAACAAPGSLDPTFGNGGKVVVPIGNSNDEGFAVAVQPDGKILLAGSVLTPTGKDFGLFRCNADGTPDTTFNSIGKVVTEVSAGEDIPRSVLVQPDGKIIVTGYARPSGYQFAAVRYSADGALDSSFNGTGKSLIPIGSDALAFGAALQADGRVLLGGYYYNGSNYDWALIRLQTDGSLDPTLNGSGIVTTSINRNELGYSVAVQPDGKILLGGVWDDGAAYRYAILRFGANGVLDPTFNGGSPAIAAFGPMVDPYGFDLKLRTDGRIIAGGTVGNPGARRFALACFTSSGSLDPSFSGTGTTTTSILGDDLGQSVALQPDGKILLGGYSYNTAHNDTDFVLVRYQSNGSLDATFGTAGKVITSMGSSFDLAFGVAIDATGGIVLGGHSVVGGNYDFALARYDAGSANPPDTTPPTAVVGGVMSASGRVYVPVTVSDGGTGVARVQVTGHSTNIHLESPLGTTVPSNDLVLSPTQSSIVVYAVKNNPAARAVVELRLTDGAGNSAIRDPIIANLEIKKSRRLSRVFTRLPGNEHYITLQNATPGLVQAKLWVNGKLISNGPLSDGQVVRMDVRESMRAGKRNTVRITAWGLTGAKAVLLIGDVSLAGGGRPQGSGIRSLNTEFAPASGS